jgi:hypothetical protein
MYHDGHFVNGPKIKGLDNTFMPKKSVHKLAVKNNSETIFSLHTISANPRHCSPVDLQVAISNLKLEVLTNEPPAEPFQLVVFLFTDLFSLLHRSGLYNRQLPLWEAIARTCEVHFERLQEGLFAKIELPIWEILFLDANGRKILCARFLDNSATNLINLENDKDALRFLQNSIKRAEKLKVESSAFSGLFLCCSGHMPEIIVGNVLKLTGDDAVARYQSVLPTVGCSVNLIVENQRQFELVLPQLPYRIKSVSSTADEPVATEIVQAAG